MVSDQGNEGTQRAVQRECTFAAVPAALLPLRRRATKRGRVTAVSENEAGHATTHSSESDECGECEPAFPSHLDVSSWIPACGAAAAKDEQQRQCRCGVCANHVHLDVTSMGVDQRLSPYSFLLFPLSSIFPVCVAPRPPLPPCCCGGEASKDAAASTDDDAAAPLAVAMPKVG